MTLRLLPLILTLAAAPAWADPFPAPGDWQGEGRIIREDGASARLRCRLSGTAPDAQSWQAQITCASVEGRFDGEWDLRQTGQRVSGTGYLRSDTPEEFAITGQMTPDYTVFDVGDRLRVQLIVAPDSVEMRFAEIGAASDAPGGGIVRFAR